MRVAHGNAGEFPHRAVAERHKRMVAAPLDGNARPIEHRRAHLRAHRAHAAIFQQHLRSAQAAAGFHHHGSRRCAARFIEIARRAAQAVSAHFRLAAIGVENAHARVRLVRGADQNQSIRAHAIVRPRNAHGQRRRVAHLLRKRVHINIIVPQALHFDEFHAFPPARRAPGIARNSMYFARAKSIPAFAPPALPESLPEWKNRPQTQRRFAGEKPAAISFRYIPGAPAIPPSAPRRQPRRAACYARG